MRREGFPYFVLLASPGLEWLLSRLFVLSIRRRHSQHDDFVAQLSGQRIESGYCLAIAQLQLRLDTGLEQSQKFLAAIAGFLARLPLLAGTGTLSKVEQDPIERQAVFGFGLLN